MKILIVNPTGGAPKYGPNMRSYFMASALTNNQDCKVTIVGNGFFHKFKKAPNVSRPKIIEEIDKIRYVWLKGFKYQGRGLGQLLNQFFFALRSLRYLVCGGLRDHDIVIYSSPTPFAYITTLISCRIYRVKLIFEVRDLWPLVIKEIGSFSRLHPLIIVLEILARIAYRTADHVLVVKPGDVNFIVKKYHLSKDKVSYIPNGYNFTGRPPRIDHTLDRREDGLVMGYVGSLSAAYAIDCLIEAFRLLKDENIYLELFGDGPSSKELAILAEKYNLEKVNFHGRIPFLDIPDKLSSIDVGYVGYKSAGWLKHGISSNKIFDYMANSIPIISAVDTDYNPIIDADCGISVRAESPKELARAILEMNSKSYEMRKSYGINGLNYLKRLHNFDKLSSDLMLIFKSLNK